MKNHFQNRINSLIFAKYSFLKHGAIKPLDDANLQILILRIKVSK